MNTSCAIFMLAVCAMFAWQGILIRDLQSQVNSLIERLAKKEKE